MYFFSQNFLLRFMYFFCIDNKTSFVFYQQHSLLNKNKRDCQKLMVKNQVIIAKLLSLRLRKVINEVINDFYSAFIAKRQILDRSILPNEIRDSMQRKRDKGFLFKVGFQKAFDLVTWGFIFEVMDSSIVNGFFRFENVYLQLIFMY